MKIDLITNNMKYAYEKACEAHLRDEVPVGAILYDHEKDCIISAHGNRVNERNDVFAHAEMLVLQEACHKKQTLYLQNCSLFVTLEPCSLCASAIAMARIKRLYFGAYDIKSGGVEHGAKVFSHKTCHHKVEVYGGIWEEKCAYLMKSFFEKKRS